MEKANWKKLNDVITDHNKKIPNPDQHIPIFDEDFNVTLKQLISKNIMAIQDDIREISEIASKERGFEKILYKLK